MKRFGLIACLVGVVAGITSTSQLPKKSGAYILDTPDCSDSRYSIDSQEECARVAKDMGLGDVTSLAKSTKTGCLYSLDDKKVYFNSPDVAPLPRAKKTVSNWQTIGFGTYCECAKECSSNLDMQIATVLDSDAHKSMTSSKPTKGFIGLVRKDGKWSWPGGKVVKFENWGNSGSANQKFDCVIARCGDPSASTACQWSSVSCDNPQPCMCMTSKANTIKQQKFSASACDKIVSQAFKSVLSREPTDSEKKNFGGQCQQKSFPIATGSIDNSVPHQNIVKADIKNQLTKLKEYKDCAKCRSQGFVESKTAWFCRTKEYKGPVGACMTPVTGRRNYATPSGTTRSYTTAKNACSSKPNLGLARIDTAEDNAEARSRCGRRVCWIGLVEVGNKRKDGDRSAGTWKWNDGASPSYTRWHPGQPSNYKGGEHFAIMNAANVGIFEGTWFDVKDNLPPAYPLCNRARDPACRPVCRDKDTNQLVYESHCAKKISGLKEKPNSPYGWLYSTDLLSATSTACPNVPTCDKCNSANCASSNQDAQCKATSKNDIAGANALTHLSIVIGVLSILSVMMVC